jgi:hypothetical protein
MKVSMEIDLFNSFQPALLYFLPNAELSHIGMDAYVASARSAMDCAAMDAAHSIAWFGQHPSRAIPQPSLCIKDRAASPDPRRLAEPVIL